MTNQTPKQVSVISPKRGRTSSRTSQGMRLECSIGTAMNAKAITVVRGHVRGDIAYQIATPVNPTTVEGRSIW